MEKISSLSCIFFPILKRISCFLYFVIYLLFSHYLIFLDNLFCGRIYCLYCFISITTQGFITPLPTILPSFNIVNASVAWLSVNRFETSGLITPLLANDINSVISLIVPVYDPINLYALVGILTKLNFSSPPKSPTSTNLALFLRNCISVSTVFDALTKSITASAPILSVNSMTAFTGSSFFELITLSAPFLFAALNFSSSRSIAIILEPVTAFANCIDISPNPPAPTITTLSYGFRFAFFTAPYAVSAEHDNVALASVSISSSIFNKYL